MAIIAISGKMGHGKDTVADFIKHLDAENNWQIKKFAGKLKIVASILTGIPVHMFEDPEFKDSYLPECWDLYLKTEGKTILVEGHPKSDVKHIKMKVRDFLQKLGTEAVRNGLHYNTWVNALMSEYKKAKDSDEEYNYPNWIISDLRFPNEYEAVKQQGGIIIRVNRPSIITNNHPSETALDDYSFDYTIENKNSLRLLLEDVKHVIEQYKSIQHK